METKNCKTRLEEIDGMLSDANLLFEKTLEKTHAGEREAFSEAVSLKNRIVALEIEKALLERNAR